jgi:hypothetical protein
MYDIFLQTKSSAQKALADESELADIEKYIWTKKKDSRNETLSKRQKCHYDFHGIDAKLCHKQQTKW